MFFLPTIQYGHPLKRKEKICKNFESKINPNNQPIIHWPVEWTEEKHSIHLQFKKKVQGVHIRINEWQKLPQHRLLAKAEVKLISLIHNFTSASTFFGQLGGLRFLSSFYHGQTQGKCFLSFSYFTITPPKLTDQPNNHCYKLCPKVRDAVQILLD